MCIRDRITATLRMLPTIFSRGCPCFSYIASIKKGSITSIIHLSLIHIYQKSLQENPQFSSNPLSRWQQKQAIKKQYAAAKRTGQTAGNTAQAASKTGSPFCGA